MKISKSVKEKLEKFYNDKKRQSDKIRTSGNSERPSTTK